MMFGSSKQCLISEAMMGSLLDLLIAHAFYITNEFSF
jgi:hypothetical protein